MKYEQRKKEDRELIKRFADYISTNDCDRVVTACRAERFIKSENLEAKPKLELNRWIVRDGWEEWMIYLENNGKYYGVDKAGNYMTGSIDGDIILMSYNDCEVYRYATDEEILERLSKIAIQKGYKEKQSECLFASDNEEIDFTKCRFDMQGNNELWVTNTESSGGWKRSNCIFKNGKWAKFIETDSEKIERLEKRVELLENKNK